MDAILAGFCCIMLHCNASLVLYELKSMHCAVPKVRGFFPVEAPDPLDSRLQIASLSMFFASLLGAPGDSDLLCMVVFCALVHLPWSQIDCSCHARVVPSLWNHGAEETFVAQEGVREEGRQEEVPPFVEAPQREEGRFEEAPFPQAQVQEGR